MVGLIAKIVWQGWLFLVLIVGIPIVVAAWLGGSKSSGPKQQTNKK